MREMASGEMMSERGRCAGACLQAYKLTSSGVAPLGQGASGDGRWRAVGRVCCCRWSC
jgi:hypothetical protein